jgi:hypothetical protein
MKLVWIPEGLPDIKRQAKHLPLYRGLRRYFHQWRQGVHAIGIRCWSAGSRDPIGVGFCVFGSASWLAGLCRVPPTFFDDMIVQVLSIPGQIFWHMLVFFGPDRIAAKTRRKVLSICNLT